MPRPRYAPKTQLLDIKVGTVNEEYLNFEYAAAGMQGWFHSMEDRHIVSTGENSLFAIFDGHGGSEVSNEAKKRFKYVMDLKYYADELQWLRRSFRRMDRLLKDYKDIGASAIVAYLN